MTWCVDNLVCCACLFTVLWNTLVVVFRARSSMFSFDSETFRSKRFVAWLETLLCARSFTQYSLRGRNRKGRGRGRGRGEREYIIILQGDSLHPTLFGELAFHPSSKNACVVGYQGALKLPSSMDFERYIEIALPYYFRALKGRPNVLKS